MELIKLDIESVKLQFKQKLAKFSNRIVTPETVKSDKKEFNTAKKEYKELDTKLAKEVQAVRKEIKTFFDNETETFGNQIKAVVDQARENRRNEIIKLVVAKYEENQLSLDSVPTIPDELLNIATTQKAKENWISTSVINEISRVKRLESDSEVIINACKDKTEQYNLLTALESIQFLEILSDGSDLSGILKNIDRMARKQSEIETVVKVNIENPVEEIIPVIENSTKRKKKTYTVIVSEYEHNSIVKYLRTNKIEICK